MFNNEIVFARYSIELSINGNERPIIIGNQLTPILDKFEELVSKYYNNDNDDITIRLWDTEEHIIIKSYNSAIDK